MTATFNHPQRGHLPGNSRDQFLEALEAEDSELLGVAAEVVRGCTDILPREYCNLIDLPQGSTYSEAAEDVLRGLPRVPR